MENFDRELWILGKALISLVLGFLIGFEREFAGKPAGMRTYMLITLGATLFTSIGPEMIRYVQAAIPSVNLSPDPVRIIEAIMVGVSFLGAGTIIKNRDTDTVENLTTAAGIMVSAAIGVTVALEHYFLAVGGTLIVLIVNRLLLSFEIWVQSKMK